MMTSFTHLEAALLIAAAAPILCAVTAVASWFQPGMRPAGVIGLSKVAGIAGIASAALCAYLIIDHGPLLSEGLTYANLGFSLRLDALSVLIFSMINLIAFIVLRFSYNYLDGDERQGVFTGRLAATIAGVQLLVLSGNLALLWFTWVLTSFSLHRLLTFYPERKRAVLAARKKFIAARLSDGALLAAVYFLYSHFGTGDLEVISNGMAELVTTGIPWQIEIAALCIAAAAILKSALFPTHGWLVEVMETPTPVSALLHAGLLNAGPFLVARLAFIVHGSEYTPLVLIVFGGITALLASIIYLTQTSVKTALGYSSVSHMGFSLLMCGMGVYAAAMLHLVAHSFYKAHAFLSSGSAIDVLKAARVSLPQKKRNPLRLAGSVVVAFGIFAGFAYLFGIRPAETPSFFALSAVVVMGVSLLLSRAAQFGTGISNMVKTALLAAAVAVAFFSLETGMSALLGTQVPEVSIPGASAVVLVVVLMLLFAVTVIIQMAAPGLSASPRWQTLAIHVRNGFYANAIYDRLVGALRRRNTQTAR
ncbi:MAG: hypothetical protein LC670_11915 [Flavobacteriales bacterium]|nr:hypothetical protein [Flavobacteriales bacterium]